MGLFDFFKNKKVNVAMENKSVVLSEEVSQIEDTPQVVTITEEKSEKKTSESNSLLEEITIKKLIDNLRPFEEIDFSPPSKDDEIIYLPVEGTFNFRFFTRMYLLRNHSVENAIISGFDYIQYQIPVKASNEELILLVYGTHFLEEVQIPELLTPIAGKSRCENLNYQLKRISPILSLIEEHRYYTREVNQLKLWIEANNKLALKEYHYSKEIKQTLWVSEYKLFHYIKFWYPDTIFQYKADWLGEQSIDIFIPSLDIGIEYQGQQHYEPSDYFGGEEHFNEVIQHDRKKRLLCEEHDVLLYYWPFNKNIKFTAVSSFLNKTNKDIAEKLNGFSPFPVLDIVSRTTYTQAIRETTKKESEQNVFVIRKYTIDGQFIKEYATIKEAAADSNVSNTSIWKCVNGEYKQTGSFVYRRENRNDSPVFQQSVSSKTQYPKRENTGVSKKICQIDPSTGEVVNIFESISAASRSVNIDKKGIYNTLIGKQKKAGGFYWQEMV